MLDNTSPKLLQGALRCARWYLEDRIRWREELKKCIEDNMIWYSRHYKTKDVLLIIEYVRKEQEARIEWLKKKGLL